MAPAFRIGRHWALAASVALHVAALGTLLARFEAAPPAAAMPRLDIELASLPAEEAAVPEPPVPAAAPPPPEAMPSPPEVVPPPTEEVPPPEPAPVVAAEPEPEPELVTTAAPEAPPVAPPPSPHRKPPPPRPERPVEVRHPPREAPPVETPPVEARAQAAEAPPQIARAPAAPVPSAPAGPPPDYLAMLQAALQRSLEYPRSARQAGIQGYPVLRFVIDRAGRVLESRLVRSSGHEVLDRAAEATLRRAAPFPPIPDSIAQPRMEIEVPVGFRLR